MKLEPFGDAPLKGIRGQRMNHLRLATLMLFGFFQGV